MERQLPKPGDRWRHYKLKDGVEYIAHVVAIAHYSPLYFGNQGQAVIYGNWAEVIDELGTHCSFVVKDTETEELLEVYKYNDQWTICPADLPTSETQKSVGWARSLDNFMGVVSSPYGDKASNCYRFERVD